MVLRIYGLSIMLKKDNKPPAIGAVVVNYNSLAQLKPCLETLKKQEISFSKVIIIENNVNNRTESVLGVLPAGWEYIKLNCNAGFAAANNKAVRKLKACEWVALINPDAFLRSNWLKMMASAIRRYPEFSLFGSRLMMANDPSKVDGLGDVVHMSGLVWRAGHGGRACINGDKEIFSPCAAAALYKRDVFIDAGGFDPDFFCFVEDVDLGFRLRLLGHRCLLVNDAVAYHVGSTSTGGQHSAFSIYHGHRNMVWAFVKNMPGILFWLFLPMHLALQLFSVFWFFMRGQGRVIVKSKIDAIKGLGKMWRKRKSIQVRRSISAHSFLGMIDKRLVPNRRGV